MIEIWGMNWYMKGLGSFGEHAALGSLLRRVLVKIKASLFPNVTSGLQLFRELDD
jgi:hypothetical protein